MNRKIIVIIGYIFIALCGAVLLITGAFTIKRQVGLNLLMIIFGSVFLLIGIRGPIQFLKQEKQSEERYHNKNP